MEHALLSACDIRFRVAHRLFPSRRRCRLLLPPPSISSWSTNGGRAISSFRGQKRTERNKWGKGKDTSEVVVSSDRGRVLVCSTEFEPGDHLTEAVQEEERDAPRDLVGSSKDSSAEDVRIHGLPDVPWGILTVVGVMSAWIVCFYASYTTVVPAIVRFCKLEDFVSSTLSVVMLQHVSTPLSANALAMTTTEILHALRHVLLDSLQLVATISILRKSLRQYKPAELGLFSLKWTPWTAWIPPVLTAFAFFPILEWLHSHVSALLFGISPALPAPSPSVAWRVWPLRFLWLFVLGVAAPIWEEYMFRGFLLPSLGRYMKPVLAIFVSSSIFMMMHFSRNAFPAVFILGIMCGTVYAWSRNLLPCIMIHGGWNAFLLLHSTVCG